MAYTKSIPVITQKVHDIIVANSVPLGLRAVYYGMQNLVPETPSVMVEGGRKSRDIDTTRQFRIGLSVNIVVYHGKIQSKELNQKETEILADQIEDVLNANKNMDGLVVHGFVSRADPGVATANGVLFRSSRLMWEGISREVF